MKATDVLRGQHDEATTLLAQLLAADVEDRQTIAGELARVLRAHSTIEEELLYPRIEDQAEDLVTESFRLHEEIRAALVDLQGCDPHDAEYLEIAESLEELLEHHFDEEENDLWPKVERLIEEEDLEALGDVIAERYDAALGAEEEPVAEKATAETFAPARKAAGKTAAEKAATGKTAAEKAATEKAAAEKTATEKTAAEKTATEKAAAERAAAEKTATGKTAAEKTATGKTAAEKTATEKTAPEKPAAVESERAPPPE